nr:hypothetical protein [Tanacetum cinerariifolium]
SYEAFHGLSLVVQLIPAVGIIAFAAWGLGPLLRDDVLHSTATAMGWCCPYMQKYFTTWGFFYGTLIVSMMGLVDKSHATSHSTTLQGGLPTPASLSVVTQFTRQLLIEQVGECLTQLTRQLEDQENVTDPVARLRMQSSAVRSAAFDGGVLNREAGIRNLSQPRGSPDVPVVPIRISTLPPGLASSKLICSSVSVVYLVLARAQHADSSNVSGIHARSAENRLPEASEIHEIPSGLDQLLRNLFPAVNSQEAATISDQDTLLSNLLHQIMLRRTMIEAPLQAGHMVRRLFLWGSASCFFTYTVCHHSLE